MEQYYKETKDLWKDSEEKQIGRVWILVKQDDEYLEVLQVAQAIDYDINTRKGFFYEL